MNWKKLSAIGIGGLALLVSSLAPANAAPDYSYSGSVTAPASAAVGTAISVSFSFNLSGTGWPPNYLTTPTTKTFELVLCANDGTPLSSFNCYAVSDAVQRNGALDPPVPQPVRDASHSGEIVTGGVRLKDGSGNTQFAPGTHTVTIPTSSGLPRAIKLLGGKAIIQAQSVQRYGDDGTLCAGSTETGVIGIDKTIATTVMPVGSHPNQCGNPPVSEGDPVCQPACTKYNGTPRLVAQTPITITGYTPL